MSKFYPSKHHWCGAAEGNLKGELESATAFLSITGKAGKVSKFITNLIVRNRDREEKLVRKQRIYRTSVPRRRTSFIIVIQCHENLKSHFMSLK